VLARVRAYVTEDVLPAEAAITDPDDLLISWDIVEQLRHRARALGIYTPHLPDRWGGLGLGVLGMALISQECGVSQLASLGLNAMAPDEGNMPIAQWYADARAARIYDGASEVHRMTIARELLKLARQGHSTRAATGDV
jgi:alkylation response protein AidB-like acyl-CoA dehydrogenase